jgi:hypothetical protein
MEPEGSLPCLQKFAIGPYPEPVESTSPCCSLSPFNVVLPTMHWSCQWSIPFGPPNQNLVNTSPLPHACHMSRSSHPP